MSYRYLYSTFLFILLIVASESYGLFSRASKNPDRGKLLESEQNTIDIFKKNANSVVYVANIRLARRHFFDHIKTQVPAGAGSGIVWDKKGHIVTNYHVVRGGDQFVISFHNDKKEYSAVIQGVAQKKDIAVLKLKTVPPNITPITLGSSKKLIVGQKALALGNPFGLDHSISAGIISALGRKIQGIGGVTIEDMIQTDSSINPGNSGGPLLDSQGRIIGVNTMIFSRSGGSAGVGFAVPIDTVRRIVPQIIEHGEVIRPGLGIILLEDKYKRYFDFKEGVIVKVVDPKQPAYAAGLRGITKDRQGRYYLGDIILAIEGNKVNSYDEIYHVLDKKKVGDVVTVEILRDKKKRQIRIPLIRL